MPFKTLGHRVPGSLVDDDGNQVRVSLIAGVYRLAVDAVISAGGLLDDDVDDDSIVSGQTLLLGINENYQFDGTNWRRDQARAAGTAIDQTLMYKLTRAVVSGIDTGAGAGSEVTAVEARNADSDVNFAASLFGLLVNSRVAGVNSSGVFQRIFAEALNSSGSSAASRIGLATYSMNVGIDNTAAAVLRPVEARSTAGISGASLNLVGLVTNAVGLHRDRPSSGVGNFRENFGDLVSSISGVGAGTPRALYTAAIATGIDNTGAAVLRPVEVRNFDANTDVAQALIGFTVNARMSYRDLGLADMARVSGDSADAVSGRSTVIRAPYSNSIVVGQDNTGAAVFRPVEARNADADADVAAALVGLLVQSRNSHYDAFTADWRFTDGELVSVAEGGRAASSIDAPYGLAIVSGIEDPNGNVNPVNTVQPAAGNADGVALGVTDLRESGFAATIAGRRFVATHQTPGANITGQTSFVATTPTFMMRQVASTRRIILRSITLGQVGVVAGGPIRIIGVLDTADRLSSGGIGVVVQNVNAGSAVASAITAFLTNPTATAAGGGTRVVLDITVDALLGRSTQINLKDEIFMGATSTFMLYTFAASTGPSWSFVFNWEEVT